jgi:hypothetical protein
MSHQFTYAGIVEMTEDQIEYLSRCGPFENRGEVAHALGATLRFFSAEVPALTGLLQISNNLINEGLITLATKPVSQPEAVACDV